MRRQERWCVAKRESLAAEAKKSSRLRNRTGFRDRSGRKQQTIRASLDAVVFCIHILAPGGSDIPEGSGIPAPVAARKSSR